MTMNARSRIWACLIPAMTFPFIGSLFYFAILLGTPLGRIVYGATKGFTLVWPIVAILAIERQPFALSRIGLSKHIRAIPAGLISGLVIAGVIIGFYRWGPLGEYVRQHQEAIRSNVEKFGLRSLGLYVAFGVFLAMFHSLLEEYFWRWYVFGRLSKVSGISVAYGLAGLAFAAHHYVALSSYFPALLVALFGTCVGIGGGFWCWLYRKQDSLAGCWVSHLLVDAALLYIGYDLLFAR